MLRVTPSGFEEGSTIPRGATDGRPGVLPSPKTPLETGEPQAYP